MNLILMLAPAGFYPGAWRMPDSRSDEILTLRFSADIAKQAERAKMDALFLADAVTVRSAASGPGYPTMRELEPFTTLGALAAVTEQIGLIATASTSFTEPYNLARYFASLDHLSGGRAGWNVVTSTRGGENFSHRFADHEERYARAFEYMRVVTALWDSWQNDAIVNDRAAGVWVRPDRMHAINFNGTYYQVEGPLNVARAPQGRPVLVQAGASATGVDFASTYAEAIFTAQDELPAAQNFYATVKSSAERKGRDPNEIKVLPGLMPIIGNTETEARQLADELAELAGIDVGLSALKVSLDNIKLDDLDLDQPIPPERLPNPENVQGGRSAYNFYYNLATEQHYTLRQLIKVPVPGHSILTGTAEQVADQMEIWFTERGCDGFNLQATHLMGGLDSITDQLIPILQERKLFRTNYEGKTLRDHFGLKRPSRASTPVDR